jgi:sigma-B regulation protein RsbU (phosphoserine phosphatase)
MNEPEARPKILIVDDKPQNLYALANLLQQLEVDVRQATSGAEALALTLEQEFCLAIVDVQMPEMDGYELVELWRGNLSTASLPVIFVSAIYSDEYHHRKGYDAGAVDFLSKPFVPEILLSKIRVFIDLYHQRVKLQELVKQITKANAEIQALNQRLQAENLRMETELDITRQLQQMLLPTTAEIQQVEGVDIAGFMQPAEEVGGDYFDVLNHNGDVKIGIGDIAGHGLESGVLALMLQTAIRTLLVNEERNPVRLMDIVNRTLYHNMQRMNVDKSLSLVLLDYVFSQGGRTGQVRVSGQHEQLIVVRQDGQVELQDTFELGFPLGLEASITQFVAELAIELQPGEGLVLYSDGITEAENINEEFYGLERLCQVVSRTWHGTSAEQVKQAVIDDVRQHIGEQKVFDDLTLVVLKQQ